jgi:hypothetical protein
VYFPAQWDTAYEPLFEMHDTDEEPLQGSTLYAKYGKVILFIPRWHFSGSCLREMLGRHVYFLTFYLHRKTDEQAT